MTYKLDIQTSVTTVKSTTRRIEINSLQVRRLVRKWAIKSLGFTDPVLTINYAYDPCEKDAFEGFTVKETIIDPPEADDGVADTDEEHLAKAKAHSDYENRGYISPDPLDAT
jgi:hypothetical protein